MSGYCKHRWEERTELMHQMFPEASARQGHRFFVCATCLKVDECPPPPTVSRDLELRQGLRAA
jgi:hypothetical protein